MLGLVSSGIADIGVAGFVLSEERSEVVAYTVPLAFSR